MPYNEHSYHGYGQFLSHMQSQKTNFEISVKWNYNSFHFVGTTQFQLHHVFNNFEKLVPWPD
jgi:predicted NAD/FAD-binding protein